MTLFRAALILGLLSAVGPFAIDMYLPAMPAIAEALATDAAAVQMTLTSYFVAFGLAQLVYGPWADQAGRRLPLFVGLAIFAVASIWAALALDIEALIAARFVQGLGGAVLMVVPRAIIRDMHTGAQATKLMAMVMLVISVSPMLAPLVGSGLITLTGWRGVFWALAVASLLSFALTAFVLPETLPQKARVRVNLANLWRGTKVLMRDPVFMGWTFIGGFGFASFMVFIASASFVYTEQFGLTPTGFSIAFAVNALGFFSASQMAGPLGERFGVLPVIRAAVWGFALATAALLVAVLLLGASLPLVVAGLFIANAFLGLVLPTTMVMALDPHGSIAGLASSLGGTLQMLTGGAMVAATAPFFDGTALPMVTVIAVCGLLVLAIALATFRAIGRDGAVAAE